METAFFFFAKNTFLMWNILYLNLLIVGEISFIYESMSLADKNATNEKKYPQFVECITKSRMLHFHVLES